MLALVMCAVWVLAPLLPTSQVLGGDEIRVTLLPEDAGGDEKPAVLNLEAVDFEYHTLRIMENGKLRDLPFHRVRPIDLLGVLSKRLPSIAADTLEGKQKLGEAQLLTARVALAANLMDRARQLLDQAEKNAPTLADSIKAERGVITELMAAALLDDIREDMANERWTEAKRKLNTLKQSYAKSAAGQEVDAVLAEMARLMEGPTPGNSPSANATNAANAPKIDPLDAIRKLVAIARDYQTQGYAKLFEQRSSQCQEPWRRGLTVLEGPNGALPKLEAVVKRLGAQLDADAVKALRDDIAELRLSIRKALVHYSLSVSSFEEAEDFLRPILALKPGDREVLLLQLLLDENRIRLLPTIRPPTNGNSNANNNNAGNGNPPIVEGNLPPGN